MPEMRILLAHVDSPVKFISILMNVMEAIKRYAKRSLK